MNLHLQVQKECQLRTRELRSPHLLCQLDIVLQLLTFIIPVLLLYYSSGFYIQFRLLDSAHPTGKLFTKFFLDE